MQRISFSFFNACSLLSDKEKIFNVETQTEGDTIIALPSTGFHSNGYSLVRKVFKPDAEKLARVYDGLDRTLGEALLAPTKIYVKPVLALAEKVTIKGCAHITGGGFYENIPRALKNGLAAKIDESSIVTPPVFSLLEKTGGVPRRDMFNTFNMGVGMCVIVAKDEADKAVRILREHGENAYIMGETVPGEGVQIC